MLNTQKKMILIKVLNFEDKIRKRSRIERIPIRQIYRSEMYNLIVEIQDIDTVASKLPKFENKKEGFYKVRNKDVPKLPKDKCQIDLTNSRFTNTCYSKPFLLFDTNDNDRIIA